MLPAAAESKHCMEEVRKERVLQGRELTPLEGSRGRRDLGVRGIFFLLQIMIWFFELQTA